MQRHSRASRGTIAARPQKNTEEVSGRGGRGWGGVNHSGGQVSRLFGYAFSAGGRNVRCRDACVTKKTLARTRQNPPTAAEKMSFDGSLPFQPPSCPVVRTQRGQSGDDGQHLPASLRSRGQRFDTRVIDGRLIARFPASTATGAIYYRRNFGKRVLHPPLNCSESAASIRCFIVILSNLYRTCCWNQGGTTNLSNVCSTFSILREKTKDC